MRFHWQNLNERRVGEKTVKGSPLKCGRCWWHFKDHDDDVHESTIRFEWALGLRFGFGVDLDPDEHEVTFKFAPIFGTFYFSLQRDRLTECLLKLLPSREVQYHGEVLHLRDERSIDFRVHDWSLYVDLWADPNSWSASDPKWRHFSVNFLDLIFGCRRHERIELEPKRQTMIPLAEGSYRALVTLERRTWKRSRWPWWPFSIVRDSYDFEIPGGIPFPGKGENSWDCGDNGLWGCGYSAPHEAGAIAQVVATVLHNRQKYGGRECMLRPWPETPLERAARLDKLRAK